MKYSHYPIKLLKNGGDNDSFLQTFLQTYPLNSDFRTIIPYSHDIPMIFPRYSHDIPTIFPWYSHDIPMILPPLVKWIFSSGLEGALASGADQTMEIRRVWAYSVIIQY